MKCRRQSAGYLLISAIVLIVIVGFIAITIGSLVSTTGETGVARVNAVKAKVIARGGLQSALYKFLRNSGVYQGIHCNAITGNADLTNISLGEGTFTALGTPYYSNTPSAPTTLAAAINSTDTTIPVQSVSQYASKGSIMIDHEMMDYTGTSTANCSGYPACFTGVTRGTWNLGIAASHASGARVAQRACYIEGDGGVPTVSTTNYKQTASVTFPTLEEGWVSFLDGTIGHFTGTYWDTPSTLVAGFYAKGFAALSYDDVWAVGDNGAGTVFVKRWNGQSWITVTSPTGFSKLTDIYCFNDNYCWVTGENSTTQEPYLARWNGSSWTAYSVTPAPGSQISIPSFPFSISCFSDDSMCWVVGEMSTQKGNRSFLASWQPGWTTWEMSVLKTSALTSREDYYDIDCQLTPQPICFAVGSKNQQDALLIYQNGQWQNAPQASLTQTTYRGVSCVDSSYCWAVGEKAANQPRFIVWNGVQWSEAAYTDTPTTIPRVETAIPLVDFEKIQCSQTNNCWAVGTGGNMAYFDGSIWHHFAYPGNVLSNLQDIAFIGPLNASTPKWWR